jgi:hypothetical protein
MARGSQVIDWETLYGPHRHFRGYGKPCAQGYVVKNGTSRGQPRVWCKACEARVVLRYGTAYDGLEADPAIFETAVRAGGMPCAARDCADRDAVHRQRRRSTQASPRRYPWGPRLHVHQAVAWRRDRPPTVAVGTARATEGHLPRAPLKLYPNPSCTACPGCAKSAPLETSFDRLVHAIGTPRGAGSCMAWGVPSQSSSGGAGDAAGAKRPFEVSIRAKPAELYAPRCATRFLS